MELSNSYKAIKGMSSQTLVTIVLGIVEVASFSIMSRLLSQEDFGYYAAITAITTVFASFSETGIGSAIIQKKNLDGKFVNNAFTLSLIFGLFMTILLMTLSKPLSIAIADSSMMFPLLLMSITLVCNCITSVNISIMYRRLEFLRVGMINLVSLVITTFIAIVLAIKGFGYYSILTKAVLSSIITLCGSWIFAKTKYTLSLDKSTFKNIFSFSGWLMASVFFRNLANQMDKLLMTRLLSYNALGAYNRPKEFLDQISSKFGGIFDTALFPVLSAIQDDYDGMRKAYLKSMYLLNIASIVLAMIFIFNGELIIRIFFGEKWLNILMVFQILSISMVFSYDGRLADCYLRSLGWTKQQFFFRILEVALKVIGLLIGYRWGVIGVAVSVLVTNIIAILIKHAYVSSKIGISILQSGAVLFNSWKICLFIVPIMIVALCHFPHNLLGNIMVACIQLIVLVLPFFVFPQLIGDEYKNGIYNNIIYFFKEKIVRIKND